MWRMTVLKLAYRQQCADKLGLRSGKPSDVYVAFAHFCGIMTPMIGFRVLECITICSSADTSQLSMAEHLAPHLTLICCHFPPVHSMTVRLTSFLFPTHARHTPTSQDLCIFLELKCSSEYMQVCLFLISQVCPSILHDLPT